MISLTNYYQPLNPQMIIFSLAVFIFFDAIGYAFNHFFVKAPNFLRPVNWVFGLGLFVFTWFILYFFIPLKPLYILITAAIFLFVSLPAYLKFNGPVNLIHCFRENPWPFIIIAPLLPAVFVKASLPPYYFDEMAYQFLSPAGIINQVAWDFWPGGFYQNLPRTLNLFFWLIFSLVDTYSPARLLHFLIYSTSLFTIYLWLKKNINLFSALIFFGLFLYLPQDVLTSSTLGYVDIGAIFLASLGAISLLDFLLNRQSASILAAGMLWGLSLGIKNTPLTSLISYSAIFLLFMGLERLFRQKKPVLNLRLIFSAITLFFIFGGYWYLKNLILFYNPIYPFVFPCKQGLAEVCGKGSGFFAGWMQPINRQTLPAIFSGLMANARPLTILFITNLLLLLFQKNKRILVSALFIIFAVILEFILLKNFSGYYARYHQHIQISLFLLFVLQVVKPTRIKKIKNFIFILFSLMLFYIAFRNAYRMLKFTYSIYYLPASETSYALGKMNIRQWISLKFPKMKDFLFFCENPPNNEVFKYAWIDPDLIWFEYDGMLRTFMTNCAIESPPIEGVPLDMVSSFLRENRSDFYFPSIHTCVTTSELKKPNNPFANPQQIYLNKLTNKLVCLAQPTEVPYLYHLTWQNLGKAPL